MFSKFVCNSVLTATSPLKDRPVSHQTGWQLLRCLVRMSEWPAPLSIFIFCAAACAFALEQLCIKEWTDSGTSGVSDEQLQPETPWRKYLIALCVTDGISTFFH
ncbi:hypothetical protein HPB48_000807 [Haemaphysalis longicornis]|uniref:Uncharacterized protein n=1 Tax=Haemaphysalis longicornis TaxID=44386 RepID=A0A9J6FMV6_HAELO|nr:hypothetical protein HPB48_000807 [Haemaphysalis longicornis]